MEPPGMHVAHTVHAGNNLGGYDMILGRDTLQSLGIKLNFKQNNTVWDDYQADMKPVDVTVAEHLANTDVTKMIAEICQIY
eukprot:11745917-Ditylum_brightwellii.AAC.1